MYTNKTQNSGNGSGKPLNYRDVKDDKSVINEVVRTYNTSRKINSGRVSYDAIAEACGICPTTAKRIISDVRNGNLSSDNELAYKKCRDVADISAEEIRSIADAYGSGMGIRKIAKQYGTGEKGVREAVRKYNTDPAKYEDFASMAPTPLKSNIYSDSEAPKKQSWFGKYVAPLASAAAVLLVAAGIGCGAATQKGQSNAPKAPNSYSVTTEAKSEKAAGLEGAVKIAISEMKKEEQSPLEEEAETPKIGGDGDGDEDNGLFGEPAIAENAYASPSGQVPEVQPQLINDRPMDKDGNTIKSEPAPQPNPQPAPTPAPAPAPLFNDNDGSKATELSVEPRAGFGYTGISGDIKGGESRADFGATAKTDKGATYNLDFKYSNKNERWDSAAGDEVDKTTTGMTPTFGYADKDKSFLFKYNHVESEEKMDNHTRTVDSFVESGFTITTTQGADSKQKREESLDAFSFDTKWKKLTLGGSIVSNKDRTTYDEDSYALVEFEPAIVTPVLVNNKVGTTSTSTNNSYLGRAGWDFGAVEPGVIGRHKETDWSVKGKLNGETILDQNGSSDQNTLGVYSNFNFDKATGRLMALSNSGDDLEDSQKFEGAAHANVLLGDNFVFGLGAERSDGGTKGRGTLFWKLNKSKTGSEVLQDVERYTRTAEDDRIFPEATTQDQKNLARMERDMSAGADGLFLSVEGGKEGVDRGDYRRVDAALPFGIPGTDWKVPNTFVYGAYEDGTLEKRVEGGAGIKLGKHFTLRFGGFNSQDKENDRDSNGFEGTVGVTW
jgi:hypothetical protein